MIYVDVLSVGWCSKMTNWIASPTKEPPERPPPCPECGEQPPDIVMDNVVDLDTYKTADVVCGDCGYVIEEERVVEMDDISYQDIEE